MIFFADLSDGDRRPVVVVSRNALNRGSVVTVVPFTSSGLLVRRKLPNYVLFRAGEFGLPRDCVAQCEAIGQIEVALLDPGTLDDPAMRSVINAIGNVLDADCEPL